MAQRESGLWSTHSRLVASSTCSRLLAEVIMIVMLMVTVDYDDHDDYGDVVACSTCSRLLAKVIMIIMIVVSMMTVD